MMLYLPDISLPSTIQGWLLLTAVVAAFIGLLAFLFGPAVVPRLYSRLIKKTSSLEAPKNPTNECKTNINNIPYSRNPNFTGRGLLLDGLRNALASNGTTALIQTKAVTGLGGIGKTQLALEYTYRHIDDYCVIWWVRSEEPATLGDDYESLADKLGLPKETEKINARNLATKRWLEDNDRWLLIFDNAQSPSDLNKYMPKRGSGHVIITSRNQNWESLTKPLEVLVFERSESVKFLINRTNRKDEKAAFALASTLGDLPLALEQAGAYIKETGISFEDYLKRFQEERSKLMKIGKPDIYRETVATTWNISIEAVGKEMPVSVDLFNLCAYLAPDLISRTLLAEGSAHMPEPLASAVKDSVELDQILASLRRYSLINFSREGFSIHRLVQASVQDRLGKDSQKRWVEAAVGLIGDAFPKDHLDNPLSWPDCSLLLPHALIVAGYAESFGVGLDPIYRLLGEAGLYLRTRGEFDEAKAVMKRSLKICEQVYGPDHPEVATDVNNIGTVLHGLGELQEARKCYERALRIDEQAYGPDHPKVAIRVNNLGLVLQSLNDLPEAKKLIERALRIDEQAYGPDHPKVAMDVGSLGGVLKALGNLRGARKCFKRALKIDEKVYGPDHPNVAMDVNNIGTVLQSQGNLRGARKCFKRALKVSQEKLGEEHPNTKIARRNLNSLEPQKN